MGNTEFKASRISSTVREEYYILLGHDARQISAHLKAWHAAQLEQTTDEEGFRSLFSFVAEDNAFDLFKNQRNVVNVMEIFAVLTLCCDTHLSQKIRMFFAIYDVDGNGVLTLPEVVLMVWSCVAAICRLTGTPKPAVHDLERMAMTIFGKADSAVNSDGRITILEWVSHCLANEDLTELFNIFKFDKAKIAELKGEVADEGDNAEGVAEAGAEVADEGDNAEGVAGAGAPPTIDAGSIASVSALDAHANSDTPEAKKHKLGRHLSKKASMRRRIKKAETKDSFDPSPPVKEKPSSGGPPPLLRRRTRTRRQRSLELQPEKVVETRFAAEPFDQNKHYKSNYSREEVLQVYKKFAQCDVDGDGTIKAEELMTVLHDTSMVNAAHMLQAMDEDGDGEISLVEFLGAVFHAAMEEDKQAIDKYIWEYKKSLEPPPEVDEDVPDWLTEENLKELMEIFSLFDTRKRGTVTVREMARAMSFYSTIGAREIEGMFEEIGRGPDFELEPRGFGIAFGKILGCDRSIVGLLSGEEPMQALAGARKARGSSPGAAGSWT
uniref:EF-hand domain-containing protein n=2 Tax=Phaeomonas parva TaxID=124430 RepID=A0A7S1U6A1_9STRA